MPSEPAPLSCMGGWCSARKSCALYHAKDRRDPQERLCAKGFELPEPMRVRELVWPVVVGEAA